MSKHCKCKKSSHKKSSSSSSSSSSISISSLSSSSCACKSSCKSSSSSSTSSSSSCSKLCYKKSGHKKCCDNPWYTQPTSELVEYKNLDVNGSNAGIGNVLTNGYGIVYGVKTPNVYVVTNNFF
jgi:hypothetical protein